jgi:hypothetical protein
MGAAVVKEVKQDLGRNAEQLALRLTRVYHVPLSSDMIDFLVTTYGANRDRLDVIAATPFEYDEVLVPAIPPRPAMAALESAPWRALVQSVERRVGA